MQVTELKSEGLKREYKIVVDADTINKQTEVELRAAGEQVKIPGFRPGFIPMKVLQQRYGKAVQADVLKQVINQSTTDVIKEKKLRPALTPQVNIEDYQEGGALVYTMSFELFPDMPAIDFTGITLERKTYDINDKDIDDALVRIAERSPIMKPAPEDTKAKKGEVVKIDFVGSQNGVPFAGGAANDFQLELGSGQFIEGFEDQLVGARAGDKRTVKVTFPTEYHVKELAGKPAEFEVTVHQVLQKEQPAIDEAFVKSRGFADIRAFREAVRSQMVKEYDNMVRNDVKKALFDNLDESYKVQLPEGMVEMEFGSIWKRLQQAKSEGDASVLGKSDEELKEEYMDISRRRVKLGLILAEIGSRHALHITREELTRAVMEQASMYPGQESKVMDFYRKNPERMDDLRGPILEEKAVDFILTQVKFADKKVSLEELLKAANDDEGDEDAPRKASKSAKPAKKAESKADAEEDEEGGEAKKKTTAKKKGSK